MISVVDAAVIVELVAIGHASVVVLRREGLL